MEEQVRLHQSAEERCRQQIEIAGNQTIWQRNNSSLSSSSSSLSDVSCSPVWDDIMCWPEARPGRTIYQPCPSYINKFRTTEYATRECLASGQWFLHPVLNKTWTNYTSCLSQEPSQSLIEKNLPYIRILYHVGYSTSVLTLTAALLVMISFRKLRCARNFLHVNLFASFVLRAVLALMRDNLMVKGIGLPQDLLHDEYGTPFFNLEGLHIECRLLYTVFYFSVAANYTWIFVEGLYLHTLVFVTFSSEMKSVWRYITFGWFCPVVVITPWIAVKATLENEYCWNTQGNPGYLWIIKAPIAASILINFFFFLNIIRILYTKLTLNRIPGGGKEVIKRRLAKSILVLIPLFGVPYVIFLLLQEEKLSETIAILKLYFEMAFNSFNGLVIAVMFCFANYEVQSELSRRCRRLRRDRRLSSVSVSRRTVRWSIDPALNDHGGRLGVRVRVRAAAVATIRHPRNLYRLHGWRRSSPQTGVAPGASASDSQAGHHDPRLSHHHQHHHQKNNQHHHHQLRSATTRNFPDGENGHGSVGLEDMRPGHSREIRAIKEEGRGFGGGDKDNNRYTQTESRL